MSLFRQDSHGGKTSASTRQQVPRGYSSIRGVVLLLLVLLSIPAILHMAQAETNATASTGPSGSAPVTPAPEQALKRIHVFISGKVQGVGFRAFTAQQATRLKLTGWVKNLKDGRVELVAEGPAKDLETLLQLVSQGPPAARVVGVEKREENWTGEFNRFTVEH